MARVKRGVTSRAKHKSLLSKSKGYRHGRKNLVRMSRQAVTKAGQYAYRDRRVKKRTFRQLWIVQINAACRQNDIKYSEFMNALKDKKIELDRKVLAQIARENPEEFSKLVLKAKAN